MPIKRGGSGEIVEEPTQSNPGRGDRSQGVHGRLSGDPAANQRNADSLFHLRGGPKGDRLEEPTVRMGIGRRTGGETRIVGRRRADSATDAPADDPMLDPPVGWLVVVHGPGKGRVLTLGNGMNILGRGPDARVRIDFGDDTIARTNHARIAYVPNERTYLLSHGDGTNLTYLDGNVVTETVEIESGALIVLGETAMRFQAFCTENFDWSDVDD